MFGREKQSRWVQEGGKDEGESTSRDADGAWRKASDFQPHFNPCCIMRNQDAPPPHPAKKARWGILRGRGGQWLGVGTKSGAGWKGGPCSSHVLSQARAGSSAEPWQVALSSFGQARLWLFPTNLRHARGSVSFCPSVARVAVSGCAV